MLKQIDEQGKITVTELYVKLRLEQSVASQHLAILRKAGFVKTERDGKFIYYSVNTDRLQEVNELVGNFWTSSGSSIYYRFRKQALSSSSNKAVFLRLNYLHVYSAIVYRLPERGRLLY